MPTTTRSPGNFDSVHGRWEPQCYSEMATTIVINAKTIFVRQIGSIAETMVTMRVVIESQRRDENQALLQAYLDQGVSVLWSTAPCQKETAC